MRPRSVWCCWDGSGPKERAESTQRTAESTGQHTAKNRAEKTGAPKGVFFIAVRAPPLLLPGSCQLTVRRVRVLRSGRGPSCPGTSGSRPAHAQTNNERQTNKLKEAGGMGRRKINRCQCLALIGAPVLRKASRVGSPREEEEGAGGRKWNYRAGRGRGGAEVRGMALLMGGWVVWMWRLV